MASNGKERPDLIAVTFQMKNELWAMLERRRKKLGFTTMLAVIGRAIALYEHLHALEENNGKLQLYARFPSGKKVRVDFK